MPSRRSTHPSRPSAIDLVVEGAAPDPHSVLGAHDGVVRTYRPDADSVSAVCADGRVVEMERVHPSGVFEATIDDSSRYKLRVDGGEPIHDPYRFWPTLGDLDLHLLGEGRHHHLHRVLGAHPREHQGVTGTSFAVWAPSAKSVRVVGDWNNWDGRLNPMRVLGSSGIWEIFVPGVDVGARYKFEVVGADGRLVLKADPVAFRAEHPPATASVVDETTWSWNDGDWMERRDEVDLLRQPMSVYEVHLGSWRVGEDGAPLTYLELASLLPEYVAGMGFTHVEFLPVAEHPYGPSWGYQVSSYFAPTARFGSPDDFRALVDALHAKGIGVIVDWVPAHFPRDEWALARFDGTALYEHDDPRQGAHPDWGTLVFNFGRNEVRNFLVSNALYWMEEFHIDGLRVDAVASMLYLDYSREAGQWIPNKYGGRENLEAVDFLKELNEVVHSEHPGIMMIAEESTAWPAVSRPTYAGGLGFGFKWNMGWMHDTLQYFSKEPIHRRYHHNDLTFGLLYAFTENFVLPLSHDEVVHGKGSLLQKMPGDRWQQLANLRSLFGWMWAHPGKMLLFMGAELAQPWEWKHDESLPWHLLDYDEHRGVGDLVRELNAVYKAEPALWASDFDPEGFRWIDASDVDSNVASFIRLEGGDGGSNLVCVANLSPVRRDGYRIGLPAGGRWVEVLNTDAERFGGSGAGNGGTVDTIDLSWHGQPASAEITLPPLGVLWLRPEG